uniref:Protein ZBED8like [Pundamilia nyererei] n=1 Tax=Lepeophtheirus salmonis TaxID=72036 RepID=A0A0K2TGY3_LEPSM
MAYIFDAFNHLNRQMQRGGLNIIESQENLEVFKKKKIYGNDEQRIITLQTFPCWMTVLVRLKMWLELEKFLYLGS